MKKFLVPLALIGTLFSCSDDDSSIIEEETPVGDASIVLNEVAYLGDKVELYNNGTAAADVSDYFLCLGPDTYRRIGDLETEGNLELAPGEFLTIAYEMPNATGGLGLYANNDGFGDAENIRDFVQWGAAGSVRENVAVTAGIWVDGEFVEVTGSADNSIAFDGEGSSAADWSETTTTTFGATNEFTAPEAAAEASIVLNEVAFLGDNVELYNNGTAAADVSDYFLCLGPGTYRRIGDLETEGNLELASGEFLSIAYEMPNATGGLGLYANNDGFGDAENILDFVQWGAAGSVRENVAVTAGIWVDGEFVEVTDSADNSIAFDGEGSSAADWSETTTTTFGAANEFTAPEAAAEASIVLNEVAFLGDNVELYNNGTTTTDVSDYFLCLGPGTYRRIGDLTVDGNLELAPGEFLNITYEMPNATGGLGLYANNDGFGDAANIRDFVQWGAAGSIREIVAVTAGIWVDGEFVEVTDSTDNSIAFDGEGSSAADWSETTVTTFGAANVFTAPEDVVEASIVLNEVAYLGDTVELYNNGTVSGDVSDYFLCLGPGTYRRIGDLVVEGDLEMAPGEFLSIAYEMPNETGGLGLYANNDGFADAANIRDFVQWGAAGSPRENVAVTAGIWVDGEFVEVLGNANNSIAFDGEGSSAADWSETTVTTFGAANVFTAPEAAASIIINEFEYQDNALELYNNGTVTVDISDYFLCLGPGTYRRIGDQEFNGNLELAPGEFFVVAYNVSRETGGLGLYANNDDFSDAANIRDFVQWGAAGSPRENVAVAAGIWRDGEFVEVLGSGSASTTLSFKGEGFSAAGWQETTTDTFGAPNVFTTGI